MHSSLRASTLNALPFSSRRLAQAAAAGSFPQLKQFRQKILNDKTRMLLMLPVVYILLDPGRIPTPERLNASLEHPDTLADHTGNVIAIAMLAWDILIWDVLETTSIPPDAASDLWPRLWAWFQFMDMYRDHLSGMHPLSGGSEKEMLSDVVSFAWRFAEHRPTIDRITTTPGLYAVATRTWSSLLEGTELREHELFAILTIITPSLGSDPDMLEQLAEGAGGSFVDLASLVTKHFHRVVGKGDIHVTGNAALLALRFLDTFVARIEEVVTEDLDARHFFLELLRKDVIQCLFHTVLTLCGTPDPSEGINRCFVLLRRILRHRPTMGIILDEALGRGLHVFLRSIIHCGLSDLSATHDNLNSFLLLFLPSSTIHHRTLLLMQIALKDLHYLTSTVTFQESVIFRNWTYFTSLVESRFSLWNDCNLGLLARLKTCDNIKCNYIGEYNELERCSGCKNVYYCCWGCQIIDWTEGGHRQSCSLHRSLGLSSGCGLASRERSYIRALLHQEHLAQKFEIYNDVVLCLRKFPDAGYFVMFDSPP
ncbi:hypothetical protein C8F04DRAFT_1255794 [Mycena alexandri]|uniref:MYND-type domain-containing protein n=1 Tax=Mycena alexandri TaxID=1745969 RepID=A0AAD6XAV4_9AGAR|nr:hypothetical protein C8F04DRAFT_1255794 [Mycena alexandri]